MLWIDNVVSSANILVNKLEKTSDKYKVEIELGQTQIFEAHNTLPFLGKD